MNTPIILGLVRHLLTIGAGALASRGMIDSSESEIIVGSALGLIGVVWSVLEKRKARK